MSFRKEVQPKDAFLDHGANYFRNRFKSTDDESLKKRIATDEDPYAQVDSGKPRKHKRVRNYSVDPSETDGVQDDFPRRKPAVISTQGPLSRAYEVLAATGSVSFGKELEDGSWEASPLEAEADVKPSGSAFGAAAVKQKPISTQEFALGLLDELPGLSI